MQFAICASFIILSPFAFLAFALISLGDEKIQISDLYPFIAAHREPMGGYLSFHIPRLAYLTPRTVIADYLTVGANLVLAVVVSVKSVGGVA